MSVPPTARVRALEQQLAKIRNAGNVLLDYDQWDRHGRQHASDEACAAMEGALAAATRDHGEASAALAALVLTTRAEAPADLAAWAAAHEAYLTAFLDACVARGEGDGTAAFVARDERAAWVEVRAGTRAVVDENAYYVTLEADLYRQLFGIDPHTLAPVEP